MLIITWFKTRDDLRKYFDFLRQNWAQFRDWETLNHLMREILQDHTDVKDICISHSQEILWYFTKTYQKMQLLKKDFDATFMDFDENVQLPELEKWNPLNEAMEKKIKSMLSEMWETIKDMKRSLKRMKYIRIFILPQLLIMTSYLFNHLFTWENNILLFIPVFLWAFISSFYIYLTD